MEVILMGVPLINARDKFQAVSELLMIFINCKAFQVYTHQQDHLTKVTLQTHMQLSSPVSITDWTKQGSDIYFILYQSYPVPPLPHSWSQTKAKTQWHRPNCNPLVLGRASQLSEQVSSSAMHWTLSERRLSKHSSLTGQLNFGGQATSVWAGVGLGAQSQHKLQKRV